MREYLWGDQLKMRQTVGIVTIATNKYLEYWIKMVMSFDLNSSNKYRFTFHVFTDQLKAAQEFASSSNVTIFVHQIPNYGWPQATLLRYQIITNFQDLLDEDILFHLDADMLFGPNFFEIFDEIQIEEKMCFVRHPGYYRKKGKQNNVSSGKHLKRKIKDQVAILRLGGVGNWETNKLSSAYVPRKFRKAYYCGATWFASKSVFKDFARVLAQKVEEDLKSGIIAKWHDESHLNSFAATHDVTECEPDLCFDSTYQDLWHLRQGIIAVRK